MWTLRARGPRKQKRGPKRFAPRLEALEDRSLLDASIPGVTLDPLLIPKFVNPLPQPLDPSFVYQPTGTTEVTLESGAKATVPLYDLGVFQTSKNLLGPTDTLGNPFPDTTVWGYGTFAATATYPGRSFVVQSDEPIAVHWTNGLLDAAGQPLPHLVPVDTTLLDPTMTNLGGLATTGVPIVTHVHGGHMQADFDGTPMEWFSPLTRPNGNPLYTGDDYVSNTFTYDNTQQAATLWYHDHAMGVTRLNVYAGLAGFYIMHDANENTLVANHNLPGAPYDIPLAIQDRMFYGPGATDDPATPWVEGPAQLFYPAKPEEEGQPSPSIEPEFFGDTILVNGKAWPVLDVEPRMYRFRVLDGSNSRFYDLRLIDKTTGAIQSIIQVGTDDGLLGAPVPLSRLLVAPGERADVVVDFSQLAGKTILMTNSAKGPFPKGAPADPQTTGQIMAFRVILPKSDVPDTVLPATLNTIAPFAGADNTRDLALYEGVDPYGRLIQNLGTLAGPEDFTAPITEVIRQGDTEIWKIYNTTADTHPIHLHQVTFQILSRQKFNWKIDPMTGGVIVAGLTGQPRGPDANEAGWKDTARMNPGEVTIVEARFDLPGKYVWHCHILEHEEHDMMRFFRVDPAPTAGAAGLSEVAPGVSIITATAPTGATDPAPFTPGSMTTPKAQGQAGAAGAADLAAVTAAALTDTLDTAAAPVWVGSPAVPAPGGPAAALAEGSMPPAARVDDRDAPLGGLLAGDLLAPGSARRPEPASVDELVAVWGQRPPGTGVLDDGMVVVLEG